MEYKYSGIYIKNLDLTWERDVYQHENENVLCRYVLKETIVTKTNFIQNFVENI